MKDIFTHLPNFSHFDNEKERAVFIINNENFFLQKQQGKKIKYDFYSIKKEDRYSYKYLISNFYARNTDTLVETVKILIKDLL